MTCPVSGEHGNCSSKDFGMTCDTCVHTERQQCKTCEYDIYFNSELETWFLIVETNKWDYCNDVFVTIHLSVNYCPKCGRHLTNIQ